MLYGKRCWRAGRGDMFPMENEKFFVDPNLFLRFLTRDVPEQAEAAYRLFQRAEQGELSLVTTSMVVAEIIWTLQSFYNEPRESIREMVLSFLVIPGLEVEGKDLIVRALCWYVEKKVDFIDAYNAAWMETRTMISIYTFDRKHFARLEGLHVLVPGE
jgi:uncharacterized protein